SSLASFYLSFASINNLPKIHQQKYISSYSSIRSLENDFPPFNFSIAASKRISFFLEVSSWLVAISELYSSKDITTIPESLPRLIIKVSKFLATLSKYDLISFLKSDTLVIIIILYFILYKNMYNFCGMQVIGNLYGTLATIYRLGAQAIYNGT